VGRFKSNEQHLSIRKLTALQRIENCALQRRPNHHARHFEIGWRGGVWCEEKQC
jgi:hypothetical protein